MKRCLYLLLTIAVLTSCEQEIPYNGEYQDPKLVLQLREELQEGQYYVGCLISRSAFFLDKLSSPAELRINDASVTMQRNEDEPIALQRDGNGSYGFTNAQPFFQVGDVIRFRASCSGYPDIEACDTIVPRPEVDLVAYTYDSIKNVFHVRVRFGDNTGYEGFLGCKGYVYIKYKNAPYGTAKEYYSRQIRSKDAIFSGVGNAFSTERGYNAPIELFCKTKDASNREVEFEIPVGLSLSNTNVMVVDERVGITFTTHSQHSYRYWKSLYNYKHIQGSEDVDMSTAISGMFGSEESVQLYSNVENGYGILSAASSKFVSVIFEIEYNQ